MATIGPIQNLYNLRMAGALPPAQGGGLSAMPDIAQPLPASTSADPIQSGIDTLMAYGRQATGQNAGLASMIGPTGAPMMAGGGRVLHFYDGGDVGGEESGYGGDVGLSGMEGDVSSGMGVGGYSDAQAEAVTNALAEMGIGFGGDPTGVFGSTDVDDLENFAKAQDFEDSFLGRAINTLTPFTVIADPITMGKNVGVSVPGLAGGALALLGVPTLANPFALYSAAKGLGRVAEALGIAGKTQTADEAVAEQEAMGVGIGDGAPVRPYGDPYNAPTPKAESIAAVAEPDTFFRREARLPLTLSDIVGYATGQPGYEGGFPRFLPAVAAAQGGGISALAYGGDTAPAGYANKAFEGMVPGQGSGMSDSVPFSIEGQQPALLSRDEYVLPADVVSQLGDGSSGAGADMLDGFVSQVRQAKYGNTQQPPAVGGGLMSALMRHGGLI